MNKITNYKQNIIALYFFIFSLGLIVSFIVIDIIYLSKKDSDFILTNGKNILFEKEETIKNSFLDSKKILTTLTDSKYLLDLQKDNNIEELKNIFSTILKTNDNILQIKYLDTNGKIKVDISQNIALNNSDKKYFEILKDRPPRVWFSNIFTNDNYYIDAISILEKNNNFNGIIILSYKIPEFKEFNLKSNLYQLSLFEEDNFSISTKELNNNHFVSLKLNLPTKKTYILMAKIKNSALDIQYKDKIDRYLVVSLLVLFLSFIVSLIFSKYFQKLNIILKSIQRRNINLDEKVKSRTKELKESKKRLTDILNNVTDFVWQIDKDGKYIYASSHVENILGYKVEEVLDKTPFDFMAKDNVEDIKKYFLDLKEKKLPLKNLENKNIDKNGKTIWLETNATPVLDDNGNLIGYIGTDRDISERKEQEKQIQLINEELKLLNKTLEDRIKEEVEKNKFQEVQLFNQAKMAAMGDMLGNIAHQWRQPLSYISTTASGIKLNYEFNILKQEDIPLAMDEIVSKTQYLSQTIETFRNFLKEKKEYQEVILQDRVEIALNIVKASLKDNHIYLEKVMDYTNPIETNIVVGELSEVIINIINNAKDVLIARNIPNPWIVIELSKQEDKAILSIEDNAGGINPDIIPRVFEPYFTTKDLSVGTGLGLYMSYKIIKESLRGKITVENSEYGAKFIIEIPIVKK